jgi:thymidylate kinase
MKYLQFNKLFFEKLVSSLNGSNLNYCIIGDYQLLPDSVNHDIDFWTDNVPQFHKILEQTVKEQKFRILIDNQTGTGFNFAFYKRVEDTIILMKIDVMKEAAYKSLIPLVDAKIIANNRILFKNFYIANKECEAAMHFLYPLLEWGKIKKEKYKDEIAANCNSSVFTNTLTELFGKKETEKIIKQIEQGKWTEIEHYAPELKHKVILRSITRPDFIFKVWRFVWFQLKRIVQPSGYCLAFCGLDGAGKTTILNQMNEIFVDLLKSKKVFYSYWRPFFLPEMRKLFGRRNSKAIINRVAAREKPPKGKLMSCVKLLYYWIDYILGISKYGSIRNRGGIVLFDRHYIDMAVHPQRFEMNLSKGLIMFLYKFIPKADFTFFLWATSEEIYQRKEEFTKEEISEQIADYNNTGKFIKNFIPIHTNKTIAEEIDEILFHITKTKNYDK